MVTLEELLRVMMERKSSDLHVTAGSSPRIRVDGALIPTEYDMMDSETCQKLIYSLLDTEQIAKFESEKELDMSFGISGIGRFRVNVFYQRGAVGTAIRVIPYEIASFEKLGVPPDVCKKLCNLPKGLILVTGSTGSGKSTTLASMVDYINTSGQYHIITIEDPIEFVHRNKMCLVNQREVGPDTHGFAHALKHVLRQDPDVVLIGEMRDRETIELGLTLAETGHLTFATLHTSNCVQTINRIIDVFPGEQQNQIRTQLSCCEIMIPNDAIRANIRDDKVHQIYSTIQTGTKTGMRTMNQSLLELYKANRIAYETALQYTHNLEDMKKTFQVT